MNQNTFEFPITPETNIGALLEHYPQLEDILIGMAPAFKKLRHPILRKTIAKVATLRQVAQIGDVSLPAIINELCSAAGVIADFHAEPETADSQTPPPWLQPAKIIKSFDARPLIEAGQQPITQVMQELASLNSGEIYELITPFVPAPLIDLAKKKNYQTWFNQENKELVRTYFTTPA